MRIQTDRFTIRPVSEQDRAALLEVYRQCEDFLALGPNPRASLEMVDADLALSRSNGGVFCGIFDPQGTLIGVLDAVHAGYEGPHAFIELLMIAAPYRSSGLGAEVVRAFEATIPPGVTAILAGVQVNNPGAIRFWERMGYQRVGEAELQPDGTTAYPLRKDLHPHVAG
jgi:ribosomal protein S18 acetylase RimI-like enzyme